MAYDKENNESVFKELVSLLTDVQRSNVVPFVGAGLSADFGFPTWAAFLKEGFKRINKEMPKNTSYLVAAEQLRDQMGEKTFYTFVEETFDQDIAQIQTARKAVNLLPKLFHNLIVTTNFDRVIEKIHPNTPPVAYPHKPDALIDYTLGKNKPLIFKIHGSVEAARNIIFTKDAYDKEYAPGTGLVNGLRRCFSESKFLFLGCSLEQDRPLELWKEMIPDLERHIHYAILPCINEKCEQRRKDLREQNIHAVLYPLDKHDSVRVILKELLRTVYPDLYPQLLRQSGGNPFRHDSGTVDLFGREKELGILQGFLEADMPFCWAAITGAGGSGKTRLSIEFADNNIPWWVVSKLGETYDYEDLRRERENIKESSLFVLDYVKWKTHYIKEWLISLYDQRNDKPDRKVRVLLIDREALDIGMPNLDQKLNDSLYDIGNKPNCPDKRVEDKFMELEPLTDKVLTDIITDFAKTVYNKPVDSTLVINDLKDSDQYLPLPLHAMILADEQIQNEDSRSKSISNVWFSVCEREQKRIKNSIEKGLRLDFVAPALPKNIFEVCERFFVTATLSGGLTCERAKKFALDDWSYLDDIAVNTCGKDDALNLLSAVGIIPTATDLASERIPPLKPDLLGEYYCVLWAKELMKKGKLETTNRESLETVFNRALRNDMRATMIVRDRIIRDILQKLPDRELELEELFGTIIVPEGVTTIKEEEFYGLRSLSEIILPDSVTTIKQGAFSFCHSLKKLKIPEGVTIIEQGAFWGCNSLKVINIPKGVKTIEERTFMECNSLLQIHIPEGAETIGEKAFESCMSLETLEISEGIITIEEFAFMDCFSLKSIVFPDSIKKIKAYAFFDCHQLGVVSLSMHTAIDKYTTFPAHTRIVRRP
jgi:NAD-dependent SIR2 family protein deacetylase